MMAASSLPYRSITSPSDRDPSTEKSFLKEGTFSISFEERKDLQYHPIQPLGMIFQPVRKESRRGVKLRWSCSSRRQPGGYMRATFQSPFDPRLPGVQSIHVIAIGRFRYRSSIPNSLGPRTLVRMLKKWSSHVPVLASCMPLVGYKLTLLCYRGTFSIVV